VRGYAAGLTAGRAGAGGLGARGLPCRGSLALRRRPGRAPQRCGGARRGGRGVVRGRRGRARHRRSLRVARVRRRRPWARVGASPRRGRTLREGCGRAMGAVLRYFCAGGVTRPLSPQGRRGGGRRGSTARRADGKGRRECGGVAAPQGARRGGVAPARRRDQRLGARGVSLCRARRSNTKPASCGGTWPAVCGARLTGRAGGARWVQDSVALLLEASVVEGPRGAEAGPPARGVRCAWVKGRMQPVRARASPQVRARPRPRCPRPPRAPAGA
jgi:hypothetical protein